MMTKTAALLGISLVLGLAGAIPVPDTSIRMRHKYTCQYVDGKRVEYDERCTLTAGLLGCNAAQQGLNCRFCGFSIYPACPGPMESEQIGSLTRYSSLDYVEGDILLINKTSDEYYSEFFRNNAKLRELLKNQHDANSEVFRNAVADRTRRWNDGIVPYTISTAFDQDERVVIMRAMQTLEDLTCLKFVQRQEEKDYIRFLRGGGCFSYVGRSGGGQPLSLGYGCLFVGIAIHEIMHALGFYHEQSRADRDEYVIIRWENIIKDMEGNFNKYTLQQIDHLGEPYDYTSIMHYTSTAFSVDGVSKTILPRQNGVELIHSAEKYQPSAIDLAKINKLYVCDIEPATTVPPTPKPTDPPTPDPHCQDRNDLCEGWALHGHCGDNVEYMRAACQKSCGYCKDGKLPECDDFHAYCVDWALADQCDNAVDYMRYVCPKSCRYCNPQCESFREELQTASRLQRTSTNLKTIPMPPKVVIRRGKIWPQ